jgi:glycopeptide antibiotics resistance protein
MRALLIFGGAASVGLGIELLQGILPYRFFTYGDLLANGIGAGIMLLWLVLEDYVEYRPLKDIIFN